MSKQPETGQPTRRAQPAIGSSEGYKRTFRAQGSARESDRAEPGILHALDNNPRDDGTSQLLRAGFWTLAVGALAALLTKITFGGIGIHGPHTNSGWLSLIVALACLPFGTMLTALGGAKWLRTRRHRESRLP